MKESRVTPVIPVFIPPNENGEESSIPQDIWGFIESHSPVITGNAYKIVFYNHIDLYGIDMCIELCAELKKEYPDVGLVFCLPDIGDYEYFNKVKQDIIDRGLDGNILFITQPCLFYLILKRCDVFVRPTSIDDYGISVAEAVYFGIPAVASDVCVRADGCIVFSSRDVGGFILTVKGVLSDYNTYQSRLGDIKFEDNVEKIVGVYQGL